MTAHYGEEIVNGQLTGKLYAPVGMTGYVPDLLMSVSAIGSDFELSPGTCGKGYKELVPSPPAAHTCACAAASDEEDTLWTSHPPRRRLTRHSRRKR